MTIHIWYFSLTYPSFLLKSKESWWDLDNGSLFPMLKFQHKLKIVKGLIKKWNHEEFGNIFEENKMWKLKWNAFDKKWHLNGDLNIYQRRRGRFLKKYGKYGSKRRPYGGNNKGSHGWGVWRRTLGFCTNQHWNTCIITISSDVRVSMGNDSHITCMLKMNLLHYIRISLKKIKPKKLQVMEKLVTHISILVTKEQTLA